MPHLAHQQLDEVLALQLLIAWAGETPAGHEHRLGWWKTDLIDEEAGGDLWKRLLPRTHRWAGLGAARRAACVTDEHARKQAQKADHWVTLFHLGVEVDQALEERFSHHVLEADSPVDVLPVLAATRAPFDAAKLIELAGKPGPDASFKVLAGGRQLKTLPDEQVGARARRLTQVLLAAPLATAYPVPFVLSEVASAKR